MLYFRNKGLLIHGGKYGGVWLRWPVNGKLRQGVSLLYTVYTSTIIINAFMYGLIYVLFPKCVLLFLVES